MRGTRFLHRLRCVMERGIACSSIICFTVHVFCHGEGTNGTDDSNPHSAILRFANRFASLGYNNRRHGPYMFDKTGKVFIFIIVFYRLLTMNKSCLLSSVEKHQSSVFVCCTAGIFTSFLCVSIPLLSSAARMRATFAKSWSILILLLHLVGLTLILPSVISYKCQ